MPLNSSGFVGECCGVDVRSLSSTRDSSLSDDGGEEDAEDDEAVDVLILAGMADEAVLAGLIESEEMPSFGKRRFGSDEVSSSEFEFVCFVV